MNTIPAPGITAVRRPEPARHQRDMTAVSQLTTRERPRQREEIIAAVHPSGATVPGRRSRRQ
jgi:hypothetical protein